MYGLLERDIQYILEAISKHEQVDEVIIFGSRAMGNYKKGSDVDLAILGENVDRKIIRDLHEDLNEKYPLPYFFDVISYKDISNEALKQHIETVGKTLYKKTAINE